MQNFIKCITKIAISSKPLITFVKTRGVLPRTVDRTSIKNSITITQIVFWNKRKYKILWHAYLLEVCHLQYACTSVHVRHSSSIETIAMLDPVFYGYTKFLYLLTNIITIKNCFTCFDILSRKFGHTVCEMCKIIKKVRKTI